MKLKLTAYCFFIQRWNGNALFCKSYKVEYYEYANAFFSPHVLGNEVSLLFPEELLSQWRGFDAGQVSVIIMGNMRHLSGCLLSLKQHRKSSLMPFVDHCKEAMPHSYSVMKHGFRASLVDWDINLSGKKECDKTALVVIETWCRHGYVTAKKHLWPEYWSWRNASMWLAEGICHCCCCCLNQHTVWIPPSADAKLIPTTVAVWMEEDNKWVQMVLNTT